jgi:anaphase-promoting complex subunit 1
MIAAGVPIPFIPFGKKICDVHPASVGDTISSNSLHSWPCPESEFGRDLPRVGKAILKALDAISLSDTLTSDRWKLRQSTDNDSDCVEEELYINNKTVVWSNRDSSGNSALIKTLSFPSHVKDAVWCIFFEENGKGKEYIVVNIESSLEAFSKNGDHFTVSLPFQVSKMIPSNMGLLMERMLSPNKKNDQLPVMFGLSHPLQSITPVLMKWPLISKTSINTFIPNTLSYLTAENNFQLVASIKEYNICILFNKNEGTHSVWLLRQVFDDELYDPEEQDGRRILSFAESPLVTELTGSNRNSSSHNSPFQGSETKTRPRVICPRQSTSVSSPSLTRYALTRSMIHESPSTTLSTSKNSRFGGQTSSPSFIRSTFGSPNVTFSPGVGLSPGTLSRRKHQTMADSPLHASFNRAVNSTPRAMEYSMTEQIIDPILPDECLEHLWSEIPVPVGSYLSTPRAGMLAKKAFCTTDLNGQTYLVLHIESLNTVKVIKFDSTNNGKLLIFGSTTSIPNAKDVESIGKNKMFLVLESSSSPGSSSHFLTLYSGVYRVSVVYLPSVVIQSQTPSPRSTISPIRRSSYLYVSPQVLKRTSLLSPSHATSAFTAGTPGTFKFEDPGLSPVVDKQSEEMTIDTTISHLQLNNIIAVRDGIADRVTIRDHDGNYFRISLPQLATSTVVNLCLKSMKGVLPKDIGMQLMIKWYSARNASSTFEFTESKELMLFKRCLLSLIGYEVEDLTNVSFVSSATLGFESTRGTKTPSGRSQFSSPSTPSFEVNKRPRIEVDVQGTDEDFDWLTRKVEASTESCLLVQENNILTPTPCVLFPYLPHVLYSLHLSYEEMKLHPLLWDSVPQLLDLLFLFASDLKKVLFQDHYQRDFPDIIRTMNSASRIPEEDLRLIAMPSFFTESPPSIYSCLQTLLKISSRSNSYSTAQVYPFPFIPSSCKRIRQTILLFASLKNGSFAEKDLLHSIQIQANWSGNNTFLSATEGEIDRKPSERVTLSLHKLGITKKDLESFPVGVSLVLFECLQECKKLLSDADLTPKKEYQLKPQARLSKAIESEVEEDGLLSLNREHLKLLFPEDQRVNEAYQMLQSSKPVKIALTQRPGVNDHDFIEEQERHLYTICIRTMAVSIGRGMFTLRSYKPVIAETFPIPNLCLKGRVPPRNTVVDLTHIDVPANMTVWPSFHNGVAAGLRACSTASDIIDSSWIIYNRPKSVGGPNTEVAQNEHAGFLLGLGLNGHLAKLSSIHIHEYLCRGNELTRVALLLGLSAARRGTMDTEATKVLSIHVEALLPPTSTELDVPPVVQVAAVLGIGLLYQGSGNGHISEVLLDEIGRPPGPEMEHYIDRESYALAAGLAFGLVTLGRGNSFLGPNDKAKDLTLNTSSTTSLPVSISMSKTDQLLNFMIGGQKKPLTFAQKEKYKTPSYQIREGDYVNADVTSPGATLALGMMFFDTNNTSIVRWVTAPETQTLLETVRPDFLMLRTLAKGLITWSSIQGTKTWISSHLPPVVKDYAFRRHENFNSRIDYETMSQAYCNIIAGGCLAVGLKFAGSGDREAFKAVMGFTKMFIQLPNSQHAEYAGRSTIESCLNVLVISLSLIMAGTGDLEVMKICRYLRARTSQVNVVLYGSHMATHMALGFLFLGGCRYTLSTSRESIAALICALFPKFPIHSHDNRYHLQAFRHLYVLAVEPRVTIPRDIDAEVNNLSYLKWKIFYSDKIGELAGGEEVLGMHVKRSSRPRLVMKDGIHPEIEVLDSSLSFIQHSISRIVCESSCSLKQKNSCLLLWQLKLVVSGSSHCLTLTPFFVEGLRSFIDAIVNGGLCCCFPSSQEKGKRFSL